jgi:hypothetical protein
MHDAAAPYGSEQRRERDVKAQHPGSQIALRNGYGMARAEGVSLEG